jgi:hypothetical protein
VIADAGAMCADALEDVRGWMRSDRCEAPLAFGILRTHSRISHHAHRQATMALVACLALAVLSMAAQGLVNVPDRG